VGRILDFYSGKQFIHPLGFTIEYVWRWEWDVLETQHDYIQWLFPLTTKSAAVPRSPVITQDEVAAFRQDPGLRQKLLKSFQVMLNFYGFKLAPDVSIAPDAEFAMKSGRWISVRNHNYLRISRILGSLTLLGLPEYARALRRALHEVFRTRAEDIGPETLAYWDRAAGLS